MSTTKQNNSLLEKLFFPPTLGLRILYHITFWIFYIVLHYSYALPMLFRNLPNNTLNLPTFLYFFKIIPEYYICVWLFNKLDVYLKGFVKIFVILVITLLINHLFSKLIFQWTDHMYGLESMPQRFQLYAEMYLSPFHLNTINSWLVLANDVSEIQFFMVPVTLKMAKYALLENRMRQSIQNEALRMELLALKAQINPHFVFNVLNAAYAKILPVSESAAEYLQKASNILRFSLYEATDEFIQLAKEISYVNQYVELEAIRSNKRCKIEITQQGQPKPEHRIPTLLLITLIENAFKHGVHATRHNSYVSIDTKIASDTLHFSVVNSQPNQPAFKKRPEHIGGLGLVNLQKRMQLYYGDNYTFERKSNDKEFKIMIKLPLLVS